MREKLIKLLRDVQYLGGLEEKIADHLIENGVTIETERCKTCHFFRAVRKHPTYQEVLTHICVYCLVAENEDYILETTENDMCECWIERKDNG